MIYFNHRKCNKIKPIIYNKKVMVKDILTFLVNAFLHLCSKLYLDEQEASTYEYIIIVKDLRLI